jgi:hypothetical protein
VAVLLALAFVLAGLSAAWAESLVGRYRLRRFVEERGYVLRKARWRGPILLRQAAFNIELERDNQVVTGRAYVGGMWTGPVFSARITFDFDDTEGSESLNRE